ncbi:BatD family protein [Fibrobacter sp.]
MENDSLNMENVAADSALNAGAGSAPDSGASLDSGAVAPAMPTPEQLGISITAGPADGMPAITVGDTFEFPVTVSWSVQGSALLVVPAGSANAKGLTQVGLSQESSRSVKDGKEIASITFTYKIAAQDTGNLHIPALRFEIPTQMGQPIDLRSESVDVRVEEPFNPLPIAVGAVVALCVLFAGLWRAKRRAAAREAVATKNAAQEALRERMMVLKQRVNVADSREWLLELESIAKEFVFEKFGADAGSGKDGGSGLNSGKDGAGGSAAGFESAAAVNLDALVKEGRLEGWETIVEEFAHARYGGGKRDGFENRETWKAAMRLMGIEE